jgi:protein SCO1/2
MAKGMDCWGQKIAEMYRIVFLLLGSLLLFGCKENASTSISLPYYNEPTFTPLFLNENINKEIKHTIGDFSFLNEDSTLITQAKIEGKIHIANFIFTSCGSICPVMTKNLKIINDSIGAEKNLVILSYSVTPWIDKPHVLKAYKEQNHIINKNWHFLTGSKNEIYKLARQSYFAEEDIGFTKDSSEFLHTEHVILVDKTKRIRGIYNGTLALEMHQLIADYYTLANED